MILTQSPEDYQKILKGLLNRQAYKFPWTPAVFVPDFQQN